MKRPIGRRTIHGDWYGGEIPDNAMIHETAYIETAYSFFLFRSEMQPGVIVGRGASTYLGTMFDVGPGGRVRVGDYALVHGARIICDVGIDIGDYALISWNVLLMDSYRAPLNRVARREVVMRAPLLSPRRVDDDSGARPIVIGCNVWIGFDSCVLPGVTIGEGSVVGARSVVFEDVPPFTVVAGNPARVIRMLDREARDERL